MCINSDVRIPSMTVIGRLFPRSGHKAERARRGGKSAWSSPVQRVHAKLN